MHLLYKDNEDKVYKHHWKCILVLKLALKSHWNLISALNLSHNNYYSLVKPAHFAPFTEGSILQPLWRVMCVMILVTHVRWCLHFATLCLWTYLITVEIPSLLSAKQTNWRRLNTPGAWGLLRTTPCSMRVRHSIPYGAKRT